MTKNKKPGLPPESKKVPIIGQEFTDKDRRIIDTAVQAIVEKVEPLLNGLGQMVEDCGRRVTVIEEMVNATLVDILAKRVEERLSKLESPGK